MPPRPKADLRSSVQKAVVPAAGLGTRFLPVTKAVPKALLPVLDTPAIHMVVSEAAAAGMRSVAVVVAPADRAIERYFRADPDLDSALRSAGQASLADSVRRLAEIAEIEFLVQERPGGLGHAVSVAAEWVGDDPFAVLLPDDLMWGDGPPIGELATLYDRLGASVIAVRRVPDDLVPSLGIVDPEPAGDRLHRVRALVEKPPLHRAPSNLAIVGRYVLTVGVLSALEETEPGARGELQITDAISSLVDGEGVYAYELAGHHVDVGTPTGMLEAALYEGLRRSDIADRIRRLLDAATGPGDRA